MNQERIRAGLWGTVALPVIALALVAGMLTWQLARMSDANSQVAHSDHVISETDRAMDLLVDMETGLRGYLLTGHHLFLEPYHVGSRDLDPALSLIQGLVRDNPSQTVTVEALRRRVGDWRRYGERMIASGPSTDKPQDPALSVEGKTLFDAVRKKAAELLTAEQALRDARSVQAAQSARLFQGMTLSMLLGIGLLIALVVHRRITKISAVYDDAIELKHRQAVMLQEQAHILNLATVLIRDTDDRIVQWNDGAHRLYGFDASEATGRISHELLQTRFPEPLQRIREALFRDEKWSGELIHQTKDGRWLVIDSQWLLRRDHSGRPTAILEVNSDMSERKAVEEALRVSEERLRLSQQAGGIGTFDWNIRTGVNTWTPELEAIYGLPPGGFIGTFEGWAQFLHPADRGEALRHVHESLDKNAVARCEFRIVRPDGTVRWISGRWQVFRDEEDRPLRLTGVNIDVTERKQTEEALRASEGELAEFFENASLGIHWVGPDGTILRANQAELDFLGYDRDEYVGRHIADFHVDRPVIDDILSRLASGETLREYPARLRCKNGSIRDVLINSNVRFQEGQFIHTRCFTRDVTDQKRVEQALRESEARFRMMADASPVLIWVSDLDRHRTYFNKGWLDFTGRTLEEETGMGWTGGVHPDDEARCFSLESEVFDRREPFETEFRLRRFDGVYRWILDRGIPRFDENGAFLGYVGSCVDITDLKHAQDALRDNEQRLSGIITSAMDAIITIDEEQRITDFNNAAETMFACSADAAVGQSIDRFLPQSFQALQARELKAFSRSAAPSERRKGAHGTVYGRRIDGEEFPVEASFSQLQTAAGKFYTIILRDVTERLWQEQALRHSEARYRDLIQALPAAVYTCDERGRITLYNQAAVTLWGREPEMGRDLWCGSWKLYLPDGQPLSLDECPMAVTLREDRPIRGREIVIERPDGTKRHVLPHPEPIRDAAGKTIGAVNMLVDITETKRAGHAIGQLAAIVKSSDDAIISKDLRSVVTSWNSGAERLFGYTSGEMIGQSIYRLIPPDRHDEETSILKQIARGEPVSHYDTIRVRRDGTLLDISLAVSPILDVHGTVVGASSIARDITEKKRAEEILQERDLALTVSNEALVKQKAALAEANKELESFSYSVSHDLRAPLRTIGAFIRILEEDHSSQLDAEAQRCLRVVRQAAERAGELIDDLLEFSRLGRLGMDFRSVAMTDLARDAAEDQRVLHPDRTIELMVADLPPCHGDWRLLKLVWTNLLSNAFKYTKTRDTAHVTVGWLPDDQQPGAVVYYVKDNGVGFDMKYVHKLFGVFQRLHLKEDFDGTGVGLAIVHRIVHRHGGRVWAEGKVDGGATFYFSLRKALRP